MVSDSPSHLTVPATAAARLQVPTIDVATQGSGPRLTLRQLADYLAQQAQQAGSPQPAGPPRRGTPPPDRLLNVVSLSLAGTELEDAISPPWAVRQLDLVGSVWPPEEDPEDSNEDAPPEEPERPETLLYALLGERQGRAAAAAAACQRAWAPVWECVCVCVCVVWLGGRVLEAEQGALCRFGWCQSTPGVRCAALAGVPTRLCAVCLCLQAPPAPTLIGMWTWEVAQVGCGCRCCGAARHDVACAPLRRARVAPRRTPASFHPAAAAFGCCRRCCSPAVQCVPTWHRVVLPVLQCGTT